MFLYRPTSADSSVASRLTLLWHRSNSIDVMEAHSTATQAGASSAAVSPTAAALTFVKLPPAKIVGGGKSRFLEQSDLTLTLCKAVLPDARKHVSTDDIAVATTTAQDTEGTNVNTSSTATTVEGVNLSSPGMYFSPALQAELTMQYEDPQVKQTLDTLVLSQLMQDIMGFVTTRAEGYENFLHTGEWFYHPAKRPAPPPPPLTAITRMGSAGGGGSASSGRGSAAMEVEEGEEVEGEEELTEQQQPPPRITEHSAAQATEALLEMEVELPSSAGNGLNTKKYFGDGISDDKVGDSGSDDDDDSTLVRAMESNLRKRKLQQAELTHEDSDGDETASAPEEVPSKPRSHNGDCAGPHNVSHVAENGTAASTAVEGDTRSEEIRFKKAKLNGAALVMSPLPVRPPMPPPRPPTSRQPPVAGDNSPGTGSTAEASGSSEVAKRAVYFPTLVAPYSIRTPLEICALDCEMCTTAAGLVLTRLTVLCPVNGVVYDTLVSSFVPSLTGWQTVRRLSRRSWAYPTDLPLQHHYVQSVRFLLMFRLVGATAGETGAGRAGLPHRVLGHHQGGPSAGKTRVQFCVLLWGWADLVYDVAREFVTVKSSLRLAVMNG
jgi:hypothetical protein